MGPNAQSIGISHSCTLLFCYYCKFPTVCYVACLFYCFSFTDRPLANWGTCTLVAAIKRIPMVGTTSSTPLAFKLRLARFSMSLTLNRAPCRILLLCEIQLFSSTFIIRTYYWPIKAIKDTQDASRHSKSKKVVHLPAWRNFITKLMRQFAR